jgi:hypothetical protein
MLTTIRENILWRAIPVAGVVAGLVFLLTNLLLMPLVLGIAPGLILRYIASLVMGDSVLLDGGVGVMILGVVVHFALSLLFTIVIAVVVHRWGLLVGIVGGALLGLSIYAINLYAFTLVFDWFFAINSTILLLSHILFGAVAGGVYEYLDNFDVPLFKQEEQTS